MKRIAILFLTSILFCANSVKAQINTDRVLIIGRNALYYEDYILAIQYFNQVISAKPYLAEPYFYRAIAKYYLDDYKGAESDCSLTLERNPYITRAYQLRGETRQRQKQYDLALGDYEKVLQNNPRDLFSGLNSTVIFLDKKEVEKAEKTINKTLEISPTAVQAYMVRGAVNLMKKDTIAALNDYDKAISLDKYFARAYAMRGMVNHLQDKNDIAIEDMDYAISLEPQVSDYYINRGLVRYKTNDLRGAMSDYDHVINKEPNNIMALFNRGILRQQVFDLNNAVNDFDAIIALQPNNYPAMYNRAVIQNELGNYESSLADLDKIIEKYPENIGVYGARASVLNKMGERKRAEADYKKASRLEELALRDKSKQVDKDHKEEYEAPEDDDLDKFQTLLLAKDTSTQEAKYKNERRGDIQNKSFNIDPEPIVVVSYYSNPDKYKTSLYTSKELDHLNASKILPKMARLTTDETPLQQDQIHYHFEMINDLSKLLDEDKDNANLYFARALSYTLLQDYTNAIADLEQALSYDPNFVFALFNLAVIKTKELELNKFNKKEGAYIGQLSESSISKKQSQTSIANTGKRFENVQVIENPNLEYDQIIRIYNKIEEINPDFPYSYYNRGLLEYQKGNYIEAVKDFSSALKLNSKLYEANFNRALSYFHLRDAEKGLDDMRLAGEGGIIESYPIIKRMTE